MFSRLLRVAIPIAIALALAPVASRANQTGGATYCNPPNVFQDGTTWFAAPLNADLSHAEQCGGQYGDLFSDGPLINPAPTYSGSSLQFTIPAEVWIAMGQRISVGAILETAPAATTSYWWLSTATNLYTYTLANSPPDAYSVLEYMIVSNGTGITGVTNSTLAGETLRGTLALPALANGCVQIASGVLTSTGLSCGSGSGAIAAVASGTNITVNTVSGTATVNLNASPAITGTPSTSSSSTAGILQFGSDATAALARTATNTFTFTASAGSGVPTIVAAGGFQSASSTYGPTSATVNGALIAGTLAGSGLTPGLCVQTTTGGVLTTAAAPCPPGGISSIIAGTNIGVSISSNVATINGATSPAYAGSVTAGNSTAYIPIVSDLSASDSTSSGGLDLGGTGSHCRIDYGDTTVGTLTIGCPLSSTIAVTSLSVPSYVVTGNATAYIPSGPHLSASSSTTSGGLDLGGTSSHCLFDFGITTAAWFNVGCKEMVNGALTSSSYVIAGNATAPSVGSLTAGDLVASRSTSTGQLWLGGSVADCTIDYGVTTSGTVTSGCATNITGKMTATGAIVGGSATAPTYSAGDGAFSRSTTTGAIEIGGSGGACELDFGISASNVLTLNGPGGGSCYTNIGNAGSSGTGLQILGSSSVNVGGSVFTGTSNANPPTLTINGDLVATRSLATGGLQLGGASTAGVMDYGTTTASTFTFEDRAVQIAGSHFLATSSMTAANAPTLSSGDVGASRGASSGQMSLGGSSSQDNVDYGITTSGIETHSAPVAAPRLLQLATADFAGTATNSSSTTATATIAAAYTSNPICIAQDTSSTNKVDATCAVSSTTVTVTVAPTTFSGSCTTVSATTCTITSPYNMTGANCVVSPSVSPSAPAAMCALVGTTITVTTASSTSNTYAVIVRGTPSASGHTFSYVLNGNPN